MEFWFAFKKVFALFLNPVSLCLEGVALGLIILLWRRKKKGQATGTSPSRRQRWIGVSVIVAGALVLYLTSLDSTANGLTAFLERKTTDLAKSGIPEIEPAFIVVLASGQRYAPGKPVMSRLKHAGFVRTVGAVDYWRKYPETKIIFTGQPDETDAMKGVAVRLGVPQTAIVLESKSRDTKDHARFMSTFVENRPFLLVTSATHMRRSAALFRAQGLSLIEAPIDFITWPKMPAYPVWHPRFWAPKPGNTYRSQVAMHEILGYWWADWRGQLDPVESTIRDEE
ncbi:MAG: YdcF family protein [Verrucomicrobiota bacterium]